MKIGLESMVFLAAPVGQLTVAIAANLRFGQNPSHARAAAPVAIHPLQRMPKLLVRSNTHSIGQKPIETLVELFLDGVVDETSCAALEEGLEAAWSDGNRFIALNFQELQYIDSSGASVLLRYFERHREAGGMLCLTNVSRQVGLSLHLVGVTSLIPFLKDLRAARKHAGEVALGRETVRRTDEGSPQTTANGIAPRQSPVAGPERPRASKAPRPRRDRGPRGDPAGPGSAKVLVVMPAKGRFTRVLRLRFKTLNGHYRLLHSADEALGCYDKMSPDVTVVHHRCDPDGKLVQRIKIDKERGLTSIVKLYESQSDALRVPDFKIWENDYLVEPFEMLELFTLTEAELGRLSQDRRVLSKQVHFDFVATPENVEKAAKVVGTALRQRIVLQDDATALYAAVKEAIHNAANHGNRADPSKRVDVNLLVDQKKITVIVEDEGEGFDYEYYLSRLDDQETFERAKRRILEENARGGLGILLMSKCADRLEYSGGGNVVRLEKNW